LYEESLRNASGQYPGAPTDVFWQFHTPDGLRQTLVWIGQRYQRPEVWVTENGVPAAGEASKARRDLLKDTERLNFYRYYGWQWHSMGVLLLW
jgi:beta-glucosidase